MGRTPVGEGATILLLSIPSSSVPDAPDEAFRRWRATAEAAAGLLASVLDERLTGEELFEDAVLLKGDTPVGAMDVRAGLRHFLPWNVTAADRAALARLEDLAIDNDTPLARAARLYRRAALEGPTADAYVNLWIAAEALSDSRQPRRAELEDILRDEGVEPSDMPIHVGLLIDLRGKIVHEGVDDHERLRIGFYEMEALVRLLLRRSASVDSGGWFPVLNPSGYASPWDERVASLEGSATPPCAASCPVRARAHRGVLRTASRGYRR